MKVFIGCYTKKVIEENTGDGNGIYCFDFDSESGQMNFLECIPAINPSYLTVSKDDSYLFALEEIDELETPKLRSYKINENSSTSVLNFINEQEINGSFPCHIAMNADGTHVLVGCYMTGNTLVFPLMKNGNIAPALQNIQHKGTGPNPLRQEAAHAHMAYPFGTNAFFVVDLGIDMAKAYAYSATNKHYLATPELDLAIAKGGGARHMVMHPSENYAFVLAELTSDVFAFERTQEGFQPLGHLKTLPDDYSETPSASAIRMHPNGQFLYAANRGHDSISLIHFDTETKAMSLITRISCGGKTPREINIDPSGKWLLAANQDTHSIVVFRIDPNTGMLTKHAVNTEVASPSCIQFL